MGTTRQSRTLPSRGSPTGTEEPTHRPDRGRRVLFRVRGRLGRRAGVL